MAPYQGALRNDHQGGGARGLPLYRNVSPQTFFGEKIPLTTLLLKDNHIKLSVGLLPVFLLGVPAISGFMDLPQTPVSHA